MQKYSRLRFEILPRQQPGQHHVFDSQSDAMKQALRNLSRQLGIRVVETIILETRSGLHVVERKESGTIRMLAQCVPEISPHGIVSADLECSIADDDPMTKLYQGQCLFAGDAAQVLMTRHADQDQFSGRDRRRYVIRVTCEPIK